MKTQDEIVDEVRDLLAYFPGRGRLRLVWLVILPAISMLLSSHFFKNIAHIPNGFPGIPYSVFIIAGEFIPWLYFPTVLILLLRINHSDRSSWVESARIITSSVVYGLIIGVPMLLVSVTWSACYTGISFLSVLQILLGVVGAIGGVLLLATALGAAAHYAGFFIPLILFLCRSYLFFVPIGYNDKVVPQQLRALFAAIPLTPATVILRNGILNLPSETAALYWVDGTIHAVLGYALIFLIWKTVNKSRLKSGVPGSQPSISKEWRFRRLQGFLAAVRQL